MWSYNQFLTVNCDKEIRLGLNIKVLLFQTHGVRLSLIFQVLCLNNDKYTIHIQRCPVNTWRAVN